MTIAPFIDSCFGYSWKYLLYTNVYIIIYIIKITSYIYRKQRYVNMYCLVFYYSNFYHKCYKTTWGWPKIRTQTARERKYLYICMRRKRKIYIYMKIERSWSNLKQGNRPCRGNRLPTLSTTLSIYARE